MVRLSLIIAGIIGSAAVAPAVYAQLQPKQQQLGDFGTCLVHNAPSASAKLAHLPLESRAERDAAGTLANAQRGCVRGAVLSGRVGAIRGAVAQALLDQQPALLDRLATMPDAAPVRASNAEGRAFVINYATCLIDASPAHTAALLRTPLASPEQRAAMLAYGDALKACMAEGAEYRLDIPDLRNHIASIAYLRLAPGRAG